MTLTNPPKVLITGCSGYIGSHLAKYFTQQGWNVFGLDQEKLPRRVSPYVSDFLHVRMDDPVVYDFCIKHDVQIALHCAALCLVEESTRYPERYRDNNVTQAARLAAHLQKAGVNHFLFSSTCAVYGEPKTDTLDEEHPKNPINPYGATKLEFENHLLTEEKNGKMNIGIFRYFNAAGADLEGELGECHEPETHLIPNAVRAALGQSPPCTLYGSDFNTRDGTSERDYIHVMDLASAHFKLAQRMVQGGAGGVFNLGWGHGYTVKEVMDEIEKQCGISIPKKIAGRRPGDPSRLVANPAKVNSNLGWKPIYPLSEIIKTALQWHRQNAET